MDFLWSFAMFCVAITILVAVHEYGHFIVARCFKVKILRFSVGFGKKLWSKTDKSGTEYVIAALPFGGYVKMLDERVMPVPEALRHFAFNDKPLWQRVLIILAGPAFNFLFAFLAYWIIFMMGMTQVAPVIGKVAVSSPAAQSGLHPGDKIVALDKEKVISWEDVNTILIKHMGDKGGIDLSVLRNHQLTNMQLSLNQLQKNTGEDLLARVGLTPFVPLIPAVIQKVEPDSPAMRAGLKAQDKILALDNDPITEWDQIVMFIKDKANQTVEFTVERNQTIKKILVPVGMHAKGHVAYIGIQSPMIKWPADLLFVEKYSPIRSAQKAFLKTTEMTSLSFQMLWKMFTGNISFKEVSGPIGIAQGAGYSAMLGFTHFLAFLALISVSLAVINLLPIPILDGGHLLFCVIEGIIRRPIPEKIQLMALKVGILLLLSVMLLAIFNDVSRI